MAAGTRTLVEGCARGDGSGRQGEGANVQNPEEQWEALETFRPGTHTAEQQQRTGARPGKRMWKGHLNAENASILCSQLPAGWRSLQMLPNLFPQF